METNKPKQQGGAPKASTQDVLGSDPGASQIDPRWQKHYRTLNSLRQSLLSRRKDLLDQAAEEVTPALHTMADLGTDQYDADLALGMASSEQEILYEIDEALNRIRNGTYGVCQQTGKPIDPERLEAIPWTRFSAGAERKLEEEGQIHLARLGRREEVPKVTPPQPEE